MFDVYVTKGQSAIEYLMTYGWMLLVVAVVGGAIFSTVNQQNIEMSSGFTGSDVIVDDFGITEDSLDVVLRNGAGDTVEITEIKADDGDTTVSYGFDDGSLDVSETNVFDIPGIERSDGGSNSLDLTIEYNIGELKGLETSGSISGDFESFSGTNAYIGTASNYFAKLDARGNIVWDQDVGNTVRDVNTNNLGHLISDERGDVLYKYDRDGEEIYSLGISSQQNHAFNTVDSEGNVYHVEKDEDGNSGIQKVDPDGDVVWFRENPGQSRSIEAHHDGYLYANADESVQKLDVECLDGGNSISDCEQWSFPAHGDYSWGYGLAVDKEGNSFFGTENTDTLRMVNSAGNEVWSRNHSFSSSAIRGIDVNQKNELIVVDGNEHLLKMDKQNGDILFNYTQEVGSGMHGVAASPTGSFYVGTDDGILYKVDSEGDMVWSNDVQGSGFIQGIAVHPGTYAVHPELWDNWLFESD